MPKREQQPSNNRSRVTNGTSVLVSGDQRGLWVRRFRDIISLHTADLGGDGDLSEAQRSLIRRAATLTVQLEKLDVEFFAGDDAAPTDARALETYQRCTNTLRRTLETLGVEVRPPRDVTPTISEYISARAVEKAGAR